MAAVAVLAGAAACSRPPEPEAPAPHAAYEPAPPPPLMGGPADTPPGPGDSLLGGPPRDAAPSERPGVVTLRRSDGSTVVTMRPIPNPGPEQAAEAQARTPSAAPRPAPAGPERPAPIVRVTPPPPAQTARAPIAPAAPARPGAALTSPPPTPFVQAMALAPPSEAKLASLQAAVAADVAAGSKLTVPEALWAGQESTVTLGTPPGLLALLQREAARLGLASAAQKAAVTARLYGAGYEITPADSQTLPLAGGQPTTFSWKVKPTAGSKGAVREALRADLDASLLGGPTSQVFAIAALEQPAPVAEKAATPTSAANAVTRPVLIAILAVLGLVALLAIWRNAAARRIEAAMQHRRERRPMSSYTLGAAPPGPPASGGAVAEPAPAEADARPERQPSA